MKLPRNASSTKSGSAYPGDEVREIEVRGRNLAEGVPRGFTLNSNEILEALQEPLTGIVSAVMVALEQCPPELASDISERGMVLTGGGALLRNLDRLLMEETGYPGSSCRRSADLCCPRRRQGTGNDRHARRPTCLAKSNSHRTGGAFGCPCLLVWEYA
ncbi:Rod shape-determining protein MreB [Cedecea neteri]|uniref:Rod shape-determining protein MreB n=1 Tax=Cedecea neteri TaxID=158822 RepID=A0A2X2T4A8_9ENTR|nr:Rod shape-determining protein MreB [Cedecea neteri]